MELKKLIQKAELLIEALPYIQSLYGKTVVIKYGGNAMVNEQLVTNVMEDITLLKYIGMNPIVVHGGGPEITKALKVFKIESKFANGLRITDKKTMEVAQMTLVGKVNKTIVSGLNSKGGKAVGLCGIDGNLIECIPEKTIVDGKEIDLGYVGKITKINSTVLELLAKDQYIPVVAPIGVGTDGQSYNINADTVAGEIASTLKAAKLMLLTDVEGVKKSSDSDEILHALTYKEIHQMIDNKTIQGGMVPKVLGCINALENGVGRTHIIDGRIPHCILLEIFTNKGIGTMIMKDKTPYYEGEKL